MNTAGQSYELTGKKIHLMLPNDREQKKGISNVYKHSSK